MTYYKRFETPEGYAYEPVKEEEIDWSIDVQGEKDVIQAFNKFIIKWCGSNSAHLIDSDMQDGQFMREKIQDLIDKVSER